MMKELVGKAIEHIDMIYNAKPNKTVSGIPSGFKGLDRIISGFKNGDLILIGGRPSMGKSSFVLDIVRHATLAEKIPTVFFSLEMGKEELVQRALCSHAKVDIHKVRTGFLSHADWPHLTLAAGELSGAPILIDDEPEPLIGELRTKIHRYQRENSIKLAIIDCLQLVQAGYRSESRMDEFTKISSSLKTLAKDLNIPIIATIQILRRRFITQDDRPRLDDLRFSGAIEHDADLVILLYREEYYNPTEENRDRAEIIVAKNRTGPVVSFQVSFTKSYMRFEDIT
jgi:replicative DNA helicase